MASINQIEFKTLEGKKLILRSFNKDDGKAMNDFRRQLSIETKNTHHYSGMQLPTDSEASEFLKKQYEHGVNIGFGFFDGDLLVGSIGLAVSKPDHPWVKHIGMFGMGVRKDYWGQGLGSKMLFELDNYSKKEGILRLEAMVRCSNRRGVNLYLKAGYQIEGTRRKAAYINGKFEDEYFIAKILS